MKWIQINIIIDTLVKFYCCSWFEVELVLTPLSTLTIASVEPYCVTLVTCLLYCPVYLCSKTKTTKNKV